MALASAFLGVRNAHEVCPNGFEAQVCSLDFTGAAPQHRFALRVECPSSACAFAETSRVKVVQQTVAELHGIRSARSFTPRVVLSELRL